MAALLVGTAVGQRADEAGTYLPPGKPTEATNAEVQKLIKLIRGGSGPDRTRFRQEFMRLGAQAVPRLMEELESGNHLFSWNAALILGEVRDPRSLESLGRVVSEQGRGDTLAASLAIGRLDDPGAIGPLSVQVLSGRSRDARRAASLALGRMQRAEATAKIIEVVREAKLEVDIVAGLVALGMTGDGVVRGDLGARLKANDDRVRRAACIGLALLPASEEGEQLALSMLADEDDVVRLAALASLARIASPETADSLVSDSRITNHSDDRIRAGVALVVAARGTASSEAFLAKRLIDPSEKVRAAVIGGLAAASKPHGDVLVRKGLEDSEHGLVRLTSVIALAVMAGKRGQPVDLSAWVDDRDAAVRDAALVAQAWLNGAAALPLLDRVIAAKREDRLVKRASDVRQALLASEDLAQRILRAELQVLFDETGAAPSWNVHKLANEQIQFALGLDNALPEFGGGGTGGDRARAAAATRVPPRLEDLRRHLDVFPYSDIRPSIEVPILRLPRNR